MLELFMQPEAWAIFATLFALEVVLGVDNVVFISVLCERLPQHQRKLARNLGIGLAVMARIVLVFMEIVGIKLEIYTCILNVLNDMILMFLHLNFFPNQFLYSKKSNHTLMYRNR